MAIHVSVHVIPNQLTALDFIHFGFVSQAHFENVEILSFVLVNGIVIVFHLVLVIGMIVKVFHFAMGISNMLMLVISVVLFEIVFE